MRIGQLAAAAGVTTKAVRFYERAQVLPEPERRPSGYREYGENALARLRFIKASQAAGLSLAEIRQVIVVRDDGGSPCEHVIALLDAHVVDLDHRISELKALREDVRRLRQRAGQLDPLRCDPAAVCQVIPKLDPP
ncbi:MAG: heavy metal-responsive transcriptional regulator [Frankiales bacterium]|nr:heavy metal-responsive transcriptional regulator [Frankiales bacterium]